MIVVALIVVSAVVLIFLNSYKQNNRRWGENP